MADSQTDRVRIQQALAKWPGIIWSRAAFLKHLSGENPAHPLDLFLAGAAGHRIDPAWDVIHQEIGPKARSVLERQPTADLSAEELWAETIGRLIAEDNRLSAMADGRKPALIVRYRGMVSLLNYMILIAKRLGIQRKRQMRPTFSLATEERDENPRDVEQAGPTPAEETESGEQAGAMVKTLRAAYAKLSAEQQFLIAMVYRKGMRQKDAGALISWSEFKTCRSLAAAMESLRIALKQFAGDEWTGAMSAAWEQCLQKCWDRVQVPKNTTSNKLVAKG